MPQLSIEPRSYSLIRAQKREPLFFFLARAASPPSLSATVPATLLCCHRRVSPPATLLRPVVAPIGQCLSLYNCSSDPPPPREPLFFFHQRCAATELSRLRPRCSGHRRCTSFSCTSILCTNIFLFFPQLSRRGSSKVNFQRVFVWFSVLYMLIFNFSYCEC